ncbi:NADH pyrophosphatase [Cellvibrio zantedeschiae]|uniref:NAD(+) diphosphatase n=1 Tax=Cellvibrio zantedeschiae TaxID=1237077 RepID=A0ABQ3B0E2_9GAMM|nr:NAD(+) diphosphatase [Cellvibrio zantedeschiae]GGY71461.1 NADH pyrophosphatase [Cellvibrio zantedeschiae]
MHYVVADEKFLCSDSGSIALLSQFEIARLNLEPLVKHDLKSSLGENVFVIDINLVDLPGFQWLSLRNLLEYLSEDEFQTAGRALQVLRWHYDHQFCGRCGKSTEQHSQDFAKTCVTCKIDFYPRLSPCIITLVTRGDECLLAWHVRSKEEKYSCLAGFIEVGESPEQTLEREVKEEVGLRVSNIRYVASQPWPFPGQLMLGYFADYEGGDIVVDEQEIVAAYWYRYDQLPKIPPPSTISGRLIDAFVKERQSIRTNNDSKD